MIKAIIFDLDNTLYSFDSLEHEAYSAVCNFVFDKFNIPQDATNKAIQTGKEIIKSQLGNVASSHNRLLYFQAALEKLGVRPITLALEMSEIFWNSILNRITPHSGAIDLLRNIKSYGMKIAICTDLTTDIQMRKIRKLGISNYIDALVTSEEVGVEKPNEKMFRLCLQKLQLKSTECFFIGDSKLKDIDGANSVGMKTLLFCGDRFDTIEIKKHLTKIMETI